MMFKITNESKIRRLEFVIGEMEERLYEKGSGTGIPALKNALETKKRVIEFLQKHPSRFYSWTYLQKKFKFCGR